MVYAYIQRRSIDTTLRSYFKYVESSKKLEHTELLFKLIDKVVLD